MNKQQYREATHAGFGFATALLVDGGYTDSAVNRVALESLISGWIYAQPWFLKWKRELEKDYKNDDAFLHVQDWALQIADDLVGVHRQFRVRSVNKVGPFDMDHSRESFKSTGHTRLNAKVAAAKARLGIKI